jgi:hypothetical protein
MPVFSQRSASASMPRPRLNAKAWETRRRQTNCLHGWMWSPKARVLKISGLGIHCPARRAFTNWLENFDLLCKETIRAAVNWSDTLGQIRESMKQLMRAQSQTEIWVGTLGAFGASIGVVNAFDGLQHLMELIGDAKTKFLAMPYHRLVGLVKKLYQSVVAMGSSDPWATETLELRKVIDETQTNLVLLRDKSVGPLVAMYNYYTDKGHTIPGNGLKDAILSLQAEMMELKASVGPGQQQGFGIQGGQNSGFGFQVPQGLAGQAWTL